eukprot:7386159-Prymnesium_polylepis.2
MPLQNVGRKPLGGSRRTGGVRKQVEKVLPAPAACREHRPCENKPESDGRRPPGVCGVLVDADAEAPADAAQVEVVLAEPPLAPRPPPPPPPPPQRPAQQKQKAPAPAPSAQKRVRRTGAAKTRQDLNGLEQKIAQKRGKFAALQNKVGATTRDREAMAKLSAEFVTLNAQRVQLATCRWPRRYGFVTS